MGLWFLALKARKAGNWPRTFYTGLTVLHTNTFTNNLRVVIRHILLLLRLYFRYSLGNLFHQNFGSFGLGLLHNFGILCFFQQFFQVFHGI